MPLLRRLSLVALTLSLPERARIRSVPGDRPVAGGGVRHAAS
jgi:hypothetical protein